MGNLISYANITFLNPLNSYRGFVAQTLQNGLKSCNSILYSSGVASGHLQLCTPLAVYTLSVTHFARSMQIAVNKGVKMVITQSNYKLGMQWLSIFPLPRFSRQRAWGPALMVSIHHKVDPNLVNCLIAAKWPVARGMLLCTLEI